MGISPIIGSILGKSTSKLLPPPEIKGFWVNRFRRLTFLPSVHEDENVEKSEKNLRGTIPAAIVPRLHFYIDISVFSFSHLHSVSQYDCGTGSRVYV
jgi:hypothetical protein